jgi:SMC interacting uncharacterized protein involved in chromosome segregation
MFSQTPPKNVPGLDTAGLVALITNPQKAAEYWKLYEQHRAAYDAYKAEIDAAAVQATNVAKALDEAHFHFEAEKKLLEENQLAFGGKMNKLKEFQRAVEDREAALAATVAATEKELAGRQAALDAGFAKWDAQVAKDNAELDAIKAKLNAWTDDVAAREAAVAEREAKADALAKLLKGV